MADMADKYPKYYERVIEAVRKLVKAKGRFHTEQNYKALVDALDSYDAARRTPAATTGDGELPPLPAARNKARDFEGWAEVYTSHEVESIRRAAIAADRAQQAGATSGRDLEGALKKVAQSRDILAEELARTQDRIADLRAQLAQYEIDDAAHHRVHDKHGARILELEAQLAAKGQGEQQSNREDFAAWLAREMPPGTVIGDPAWWAPRILRAACAPDKVAAAIQWISTAQHGDNCFVSDHYEGDPGNRCNCGKDSVLEFLESDAAPASAQPADPKNGQDDYVCPAGKAQAEARNAGAQPDQ